MEAGAVPVRVRMSLEGSFRSRATVLMVRAVALFLLSRVATAKAVVETGSAEMASENLRMTVVPWVLMLEMAGGVRSVAGGGAAT